MALYDKPTWQLMRDMADQLLTEPGAILTKDQIHDWFRDRYPRIKKGTLDAHLNRMSTNVASRVHYSGKLGKSDDLLFRLDPRRFRRYNQQIDPPPIYERSITSNEQDSGCDPISDTAESNQVGSEFAYESDLRDYLAKNLYQIEAGMRLYEDDRISGIEFPVGGRFIDILAVDVAGNLVVIELKVSRGYDRVVGQIFRYIGWIRENLAEDKQKVRGIIVAREISADLKLACAETGRIELFEYALSLKLKKLA